MRFSWLQVAEVSLGEMRTRQAANPLTRFAWGRETLAEGRETLAGGQETLAGEQETLAGVVLPAVVLGERDLFSPPENSPPPLPQGTAGPFLPLPEAGGAVCPFLQLTSAVE